MEIFLILWQIFIGIYIVAIVLAVINIVFKKADSTKTLTWLLVALFAPFGPFIYFAIGKNQLTPR